MISNRSYLLLLALLLLAFVPAILLRDFNLVNELNYLGIAQDALDRGNFFVFYRDGVPYADKPPSYLWLCMFGLYFFGPHYAMSFLLFVLVLALLFSIVLMDRAFGSNFCHQERLLLMLGCGAMLFTDVCAVVGRMDMLFVAAMLFSYIKLIKRYSLLKNQKALRRLGDSTSISYGNLAIPVSLFLGIFIKGPYALIMPVVALIMVMAYNRDLKRFFVVFRPYYLLIILLLLMLWGVGVYLDGGKAYLEELFIGQSAERLAGSTGHPRPFYYYFVRYPMLLLPVGLTALYFMIWHLYLAYKYHQAQKLKQKQKQEDGAQIQEHKVLSLKQQASLFFFLSVLIVVTIPSSKLEIYLLPGVLPLFYYVALSYRQMYAMHQGIDLSVEQDYLTLPASLLNKSHSEALKEASTSDAASAASAASENTASAHEDDNAASHASHASHDKGQLHWGLELEENGETLIELKARSERMRLPWLLTLSLMLPLLVYVSLFGAFFYLYPQIPQLQDPMIGVAFGVLAFCSLGAIFFLLNRLLILSLAACGVATLGLIFFAGLSMPYLNTYLGTGEVISRISKAVDQGASTKVCAFDYRNAYAMYVYDQRLEIIETEKEPELNACLQQNAHIMFSRSHIRDYPEQTKLLYQYGAQLIGENLLLLSQSPQHSLNAPTTGDAYNSTLQNH